MSFRRIDGARSLGAPRGTTLVAIGNFDGVHRGHRVVLSSAVDLARARNLAPLVLTFHPHPTEVLGRGRQAVLTALPRKIDLLCAESPELRVVVEPFTMQLAGMSPRQFAEELLVEQLGAAVVIVGQNFRFGKGRSGDLAVLEALGRELGFEARAEELTGDGAGPISSSRIRAAIAAGDMALASGLLGRPHALTGDVVHGQGRGRSIGVPTANLDGIVEALPPYGVYACHVSRVGGPSGGEPVGQGVVNIGDRPTLGAGFSVEVHLLDFEGDLYGATLRLHLVERLREERRFPSLDALTSQIGADIEATRAILGSTNPVSGS